MSKSLFSEDGWMPNELGQLVMDSFRKHNADWFVGIINNHDVNLDDLNVIVGDMVEVIISEYEEKKNENSAR